MTTIFGIDILTFLILGSAVSGLIVLLLPRANGTAHAADDHGHPSDTWQTMIAKYTALGLSVVMGGIAVWVFANYNRDAGGFQYVFQTNWFSLIGASWHMGVDGISVAMVLLTGILTPLAILISFEVHDRVNMHMALILFFEAALFGVFVAQDLMIFFLFYEFSLVPMYFLIDQWGGPNRKYAATKFFIYSLGGSLGMLLATQLVGWSVSTVPADVVETLRATTPALVNYTAGTPTFDIQILSALWPALTTQVGGMFLGASIEAVKALAFVGFFVAFAIKVPVFPFHTWLPDAHSEAPTAGSMLLAGVMLKLGAYGFIRLVVPFFPDVWVAEINFLGFLPTNAAGIFAFLAMLSIVQGAFAAYGQHDIKRLVAYSSVNHMGFVSLGIAVMAVAYGNMYVASDGTMLPDAINAANGAVIQMFNHGLSSAGMFLLAGAIYHKTHTRDTREYGGFWVKAPIYGGIFIFTSMASLGLPGLNGFVGEFLVVRGAWPVFTWLTVVSMIGLLLTGSYILKGIRSVLHGPFNMKWRDTHLEIEVREIIAIAPLIVLMLVTGLLPNWILTVINDSVTRMLGG